MKISMCVMDVQREDDVRRIRREDISEAFVDTAETIIELTHEGAEHGFLGHTFAIYADDRCVGVLLLGEAVPWETDPPEMQHEPFYRLMGFIIDREYRMPVLAHGRWKRLSAGYMTNLVCAQSPWGYTKKTMAQSGFICAMAL